MKTTMSKVLLGRVVIEFLFLLLVFVANDYMTAPSESTATAVWDAVKKEQLEPICSVEVSSAIRSGAFCRFGFYTIGVATILLLCSDLWMLWRFRRETRSAGAVGDPQTPLH